MASQETSRSLYSPVGTLVGGVIGVVLGFVIVLGNVFDADKIISAGIEWVVVGICVVAVFGAILGAIGGALVRLRSSP